MNMRSSNFQLVVYVAVFLVITFMLVSKPQSSQPTILTNTELVEYSLSELEIPEELPGNMKSWFGMLNPSVIIHDRYIYVLLRRNLYANRMKKKGYKSQPHSAGIILEQYDYNWNLIASKMLEFNRGQIASDPLCLEKWSVGIEDGRMFAWDNELFALGAVCHAIDEETARIDQYVINMGMDINRVNDIHKRVELINPDTKTVPNEKGIYNGHKGWLMEKNWLPFEEDGVLYVVYSIAPRFCVKRVDLERKTLWKSKCSNLPIDKGATLRGSAGVIELYINDHRYLATLSHRRKDDTYVQFLVIFDPKTFKPLTVSKGFTFDCMNDWGLADSSLRDCGIVFVTTMLRISDDKILFGFGWQDRVAILTTVAEQQLTELISMSASVSAKVKTRTQRSIFKQSRGFTTNMKKRRLDGGHFKAFSQMSREARRLKESAVHNGG